MKIWVQRTPWALGSYCGSPWPNVKAGSLASSPHSMQHQHLLWALSAPPPTNQWTVSARQSPVTEKKSPTKKILNHLYFHVSPQVKQEQNPHEELLSSTRETTPCDLDIKGECGPQCPGRGVLWEQWGPLPDTSLPAGSVCPNSTICSHTHPRMPF